MNARKGKYWTIQEEKLLYDLTVNYVPISDIAEKIQRTSGAVRARQILLGLREQDTDILIEPFPDFNPLRVSFNDIKKADYHSQSFPIPSNVPNIKKFDDVSKRINEEPNLIERLWLALAADADTLFNSRWGDNSIRNASIFKSRIAPTKYHGQLDTIRQLAELHGISTTRVSQIENKGYKALRIRIRRKRSWLFEVLHEYKLSVSTTDIHAPYHELSQLLHHDTYSDKFSTVILNSMRLVCKLDEAG